MTTRNHPWLVSLTVHTLLLGTALTLIRIPEPPPAVRMHLSSPGTAKTTRTSLAVPTMPSSQPGAPALPVWKEHGAAAEPARPPSAPVSLDELLGPPEQNSPPANGWISEGYAPPPLPPPDLAPPQGARWSLVISIPAGGGPGNAEGLDSGHPELDRWLESYLRSVSFPPSLDGQPYQLHWNLVLVSDRPR